MINPVEKLREYQKRTGFLTNFPEESLSIYQQAIEQYRVINPTVKFTIGEGYMRRPYGLYLIGGRGAELREFWKIVHSLNSIAE